MRWRLLHGVPDEEVQRLVSISRRRRFASKEVVCHRGDPADSMHLIVKGRFAVQVTTPVGDTATVAMIGPGDSFGELALITHDTRRAATVTAVEEAETFAVVKGEFDGLRGEHPSVNDVLLAFLAGELGRQHELLLEALYLPVEKRLLRRLRRARRPLRGRCRAAHPGAASGLAGVRPPDREPGAPRGTSERGTLPSNAAERSSSTPTSRPPRRAATSLALTSADGELSPPLHTVC